MLLNPTKQENGAKRDQLRVDESEQRRPFSGVAHFRVRWKDRIQKPRSARSLVWLRPSPGRVRRRQHQRRANTMGDHLKVDLTLDDSLRSERNQGEQCEEDHRPERHERLIDVKRPVSSAQKP